MDAPEQATYTKFNRRRFRLIEVCEREVRCHMHRTLQWAAEDKDPNETFRQYCDEDKHFSKDQIKTMDSDCTGDNFDVSLLYQCIKVVYDKNRQTPSKVRGKVVNLCIRLRDFRNDLYHNYTKYTDEEFIDKINEIRNLLEKLITKAGALHKKNSKEIKEFIDKLYKTINRLRDDPLTPQDIKAYEEELLYKLLQKKLKTEGRKELEEIYAKVTITTPASLIVGSDLEIEVSKIFTTLQFVDNSREGKKKSIEYEEILQHFTKKRSLILVEGAAGSGKTTLMKFIISEWMSGRDSLKEIGDYDLVILLDCRNPNLSSLYELLSSLMPRSTRMLHREDLLPVLFQMSVLFIVDSLDELKDKSQDLFMEILNAKNNDNLDVLVFTRPEKVEDFTMKVPANEYVYMKIEGIPLGKRGDFIKGYMEALKAKHIHIQDTNELHNFLESTGSQLDFLWNIPLYLVMVTLLWVFAPKRVSKVTTPTELYMELLDLIIKKLRRRLMGKETITTEDQNKSNMLKKLRAFLFILSKISLENEKDSSVVLSQESITKLQQACQNLPENEVLGAFLVLKNCWTDISLTFSVSFSHRGLMDFFAALYLNHRLFYGKKDDKDCNDAKRNIEKAFLNSKIPESYKSQLLESTESILSQEELMLPSTTEHTKSSTKALTSTSQSIENILKELYDNKHDFQLSKFQEPLIHLLGLVHEISPHSIKELVKLISKTGVKNTDQWLEVLSRVKCDETVAKWIAEDRNTIDYDKIYVTDELVYGAYTLFQQKIPSDVDIQIEREAKTVVRLQELLELMAEHKVKVNRLHLEGDYEMPRTFSDPLDSIIPQVLLRCQVKDFKGRARWIFGETPLPLKVTEVQLSVENEEDVAGVKAVFTMLPNLENLEIHFHVEMSPLQKPELRKKLPSLSFSTSVFNENLEWIIDMLSSVRPASDVWRAVAHGKGREVIEIPNWEFRSLKLRHSHSGCESVFYCHWESMYAISLLINSPHGSSELLEKLGQILRFCSVSDYEIKDIQEHDRKICAPLYDVHLQDGDGMTILHWAAKLGYADLVHDLIKECGMYPFVMTCKGQTPADLAEQEGHTKVLEVISAIPSPKFECTIKDMLHKLNDYPLISHVNVNQLKNILWANTSLLPFKGAVIEYLRNTLKCDRSQMLSLLMAAGLPMAAITISDASFLSAIYRDTSITFWTRAYIMRRFFCGIVQEYQSLKDNKGLTDGIKRILNVSKDPTNVEEILAKLVGEKGRSLLVEASWPSNDPEYLGSLLREAIKKNCPLVCSLLYKAGGRPFLGQGDKNAVIEAIKNQSWKTLFDLVWYMEASLYVHDSNGDLLLLTVPSEIRQGLEEIICRKEEESLKIFCQYKRMEKRINENRGFPVIWDDHWMMDVPKRLFEVYRNNGYDGQMVPLLTPKRMTAGFSIAAQCGLSQLLYLLVRTVGIDVNTVVDTVTGTTALHQVVCHGKRNCVVLLLGLGADPSLPDHYGQTAAHFASMFGHKDVYEDICKHKNYKSSKCRAGTTPEDIVEGFKNHYDFRQIANYDTDNHCFVYSSKAIELFLNNLKWETLQEEVNIIKVDFTEGEAQTVRDVVCDEVRRICNKVAEANKIFIGEPRLIGSSSDGTKLFAPDEFDVNLILDKNLLSSVEVVDQETFPGHSKKFLEVKMANPDMDGKNLMNFFYEVVKKCLEDHRLEDKRLSLVPHGVTRTQFGVTLHMAWQGMEYLLLYMKMNLSPVVEVSWINGVPKPFLIPPDVHTIQISCNAEGFWKCNFAEIETLIFRNMTPEEMRVYLFSKSLFSRIIQKFGIADIEYHIEDIMIDGLPTHALTVKSAFFRCLEKKRKANNEWPENELLQWVSLIFKDMCYMNSLPYFAEDFEKPIVYVLAPEIVRYLSKLMK